MSRGTPSDKIFTDSSGEGSIDVDWYRNVLMAAAEDPDVVTPFTLTFELEKLGKKKVNRLQLICEGRVVETFCFR